MPQVISGNHARIAMKGVNIFLILLPGFRPWGAASDAHHILHT